MYFMQNYTEKKNKSNSLSKSVSLEISKHFFSVTKIQIFFSVLLEVMTAHEFWNLPRTSVIITQKVAHAR